MTNALEPLETYRLMLTRVPTSDPVEVAFFLRDVEDNVIRSGRMYFRDIRPNFKTAFDMSEANIATLESNVACNKEYDYILRGVKFSPLRIAGLLPPVSGTARRNSI